jgi:hypothetical protein
LLIVLAAPGRAEEVLNCIDTDMSDDDLREAGDRDARRVWPRVLDALVELAKQEPDMAMRFTDTTRHGVGGT